MVAFIISSCNQEPKNDIGEKEINQELKTELAQIMRLDQKYRSYLNQVSDNPAFKDSLISAWNVPEDSLMNSIWDRQLETDSLNQIRVAEIINKYGYPGKTMVGENENRAVWYVIQHAPVDTINKYLPIIKEAANNGELSKALVGMMEDRMLMFQGKEQIYGSQGQSIRLKNGEQLWVIWPVKDPDNVNELRKEVGFNDTIEENAKAMGIEYKAYTLEELKEITDSLPYPK